MTLKKREFTPESGSVDTYDIISIHLMARFMDPFKTGPTGLFTTVYYGPSFIG